MVIRTVLHNKAFSDPPDSGLDSWPIPQELLSRILVVQGTFWHVHFLAFSNTETRIKTRRCLELICFAPVHVMQKTTCRWKANTGVSQIRYNEALRLFPGQAHQRSSMLFLAAALLIKSLKFRTWVLVLLPILSKPPFCVAGLDCWLLLTLVRSTLAQVSRTRLWNMMVKTLATPTLLDGPTESRCWMLNMIDKPAKRIEDHLVTDLILTTRLRNTASLA